jgi:hypothetical protein
MIRTVLLAFAACLAACSASANDDHCRYTANCDYEIRERLLSIPVWTFEMARAQRTLITGEVRFKLREQRLVADVDVGWKCEAEVKFVEGGFMVGCDDPKKYVQVVDAYQSILGTYIFTLRPPR